MSQFKVQDQQRSAWCWAAASATVGDYFYSNQPSISQCDIAKKVCRTDSDDCCKDGSEICNEGKRLSEVLKVLSEELKRPLHYERFDTPIEFGRVREQLRLGYPVCARVQWYEGRGHVVIIYGYSRLSDGTAWLKISDPIYKSPLIPYEMFRNYYRGNGRWTHTYLVSPKES